VGDAVARRLAEGLIQFVHGRAERLFRVVAPRRRQGGAVAAENARAAWSGVFDRNSLAAMIDSRSRRDQRIQAA